MSDATRASSRRTAATVVAGVAAVVLAACTAGLEDATPKPKPTATATATATADHLDPGSVEDLRRGCENIRDGYPDAAAYAGEGPHTVAVFANDLVSDAETGGRPEYQLANSELPDSMLAMPESPDEVALLACGDTEPGDEQLNVCTYESIIGLGGSHEIPLYSQRYTFTVYELRTGRVVDTLMLESQMRQPASSCPRTLDGGSRFYAKAQPYELNELFEDVVTGPAR